MKAVIAGLPADLVDLSLAGNVDDFASAELVDQSWKRNTYNGIVTKSVVVFALRNGNPKHIKSWNDLVRADAA